MNAPPQFDELTGAPPVIVKPTGYSLALNFLPLLYLLLGAAVFWVVHGTGARLGVGLGWIYLLPPLAGRAAIYFFGMPQGEGLDQEARAYRVWWFLVQLQVPFNRFGVFEEVLRMVPGLYALWLNCWGARVSPMVYWGPAAMVVDRQSVRVGPGVVVGTRAVLAGHLAVKDFKGVFRVTLAPVEIEAGALIGAYVGIGPGCRVAAGEEVPTATFLRPFTHWQAGRRAKGDRPRLA